MTDLPVGMHDLFSTPLPQVAPGDPTRKAFRLGELFSGPGGIGKAAQMARVPGTEFEIVHQWANDYDESTCRTYARNITGDPDDQSVICHDIKTLDYQQLADLGSIDGLAFGFPCNDFSSVGESLGFEGKFGPLYSYGIKALLTFKPVWFIAENVGGLTSSRQATAFKQILADMRRAGYKLTPHLYHFEKYGVPQARHRVIIIGIRNDVDVTFSVPDPAPWADADVSARTALTVPPIPVDARNNELTRQSPKVIERLENIPAGKSAFNSNLPEHLQINTSTKISQIYRRLHPDRPSYTITGSGGGGTHVYHWEEPRALTNRERARLQTFPDDFVFEGNKESVRRQIGMAVPVAGAQVIFEALLKSFAGIPYPSIPSTYASDY